MRTIWLSCIVLVPFLTLCQTASILMFHIIPLHSHLMFLRPLAQGLAERNHSVTVYTSDPNFGCSKNIKVVLLEMEPFMWKKGSLQEKANMLTMQNTAHAFTKKVFEKLIASEPIQKLIRSNDTYDAVISNTMFYFQCLSVFQHRFNALGIEFMPHPNNPANVQWIGSEYNPAYVRSMFNTALNDQLTFFDRLVNTLEVMFLVAYTNLFFLPLHQAIIDENVRYPGYETRPPLTELLSNRSLVLVNGHPLLSTMAPIAPIQKDLAGLTIQPRSPLTGKFKEFVENAEHGIIVMSWGTLIHTNDEDDADLENMVLEALGRLKQRTLWKTKRINFSKPIPENVLVSDWLPQSDLLGDERTKLLITHGGFNSMVEAIHYGIPVLVTPFTLDQPRTAAKVAFHGIGTTLYMDNFTIDTFVRAINEVIDNKKYKTAAERLSRIFNDRMVSPKEEALYWIEYVLKHGNVLQSPKTFMSHLVLWNLDTIGFIIMTPIFLILCLKKLVTSLISLRTCKRKSD